MDANRIISAFDGAARRGPRETVTQARARLLYVGTYERVYPRNALTIAALRRAGYGVREIHAPVWERTRDKTAGLLRPLSLVRLSLRLVAAYASLGVRLIGALPRADAVVSGYIGQPDMLILGPLARLARRPLIFNPLVTLTDTLVEDRRLVAPDGIAARLIALVDRTALRLATMILVDTPENGAYLTRRFEVDPARIAHVDVGADERVFAPGAEVAATKPTGLRVLFYGKFTPLHGIETIIDAAKLLEAEQDITFEIIGDGQTASAMVERAGRLGLRSVSFTPWVSYERLPERIAAADVVLGIFGAGDKAARVVPNKVFQAMAMGAAIVTRDSPAIQRVLADGWSALLVPPGDPEALARAILRLRNSELRFTLGRDARAGFEAHGSLAALSAQLDDALAPLLAGQPATVRAVGSER